MTRIAPAIPAPTDLLCESCGYVLNGLPRDSRCPECGTEIASSTGEERKLPAWEALGGPGGRLAGFVRTSLQVLFQPTRFFRHLATRGDPGPALRFARVHWVLVSLAFGVAAYGHMAWQYQWLVPGQRRLWVLALLVGFTYLAMEVINRFAAKLTAWEAAYRGIRLPYAVVLRGLAYHAAHYPPVALVVLVTVAMHLWVLFSPYLSEMALNISTVYLYVLSAEVIIAAVYLFWTYWIGMRNMMYANR
jgi:hypothetical protein